MFKSVSILGKALA